MSIHRELILASDRLPSLPAVALKVIELARDPDSDVRDVIRIIKSDPALAAKILRTVNSSLLGLRHQVTTIEQAIPLLGQLAVSSLVLSFTLLPDSMQRGRMGLELGKIWRSSLTQAVAGNELAKHAGEAAPAEYFVVGLLEDVGSLALLRTIPDEYLQVLEEWEQSEELLVAVEQERLGMTHVEVTVELFRRWRFPDRFLRAAAGHHCDHSDLGLAAGTDHGHLQAALAASAAIADYFCRKQRRGAGERVEELLASQYGIRGEDLHGILDRINNRVREAVEVFATDKVQYPSYDEIVAAARAELVNIACRAGCDRLTGLYTKTNFEDLLSRSWQRAAANHESLGLILLDLDHFHQLNSTAGVPVGNKVLKSVARLLESLAGRSKPMARFGGDEFAILCPGGNEQDVLALSEAARRAVACQVTRCGGHSAEVTASLGSAVCNPSAAAQAPRDLIREAARALDEARSAGGNQLRMARPDQPHRVEALAEPFPA